MALSVQKASALLRRRLDGEPSVDVVSLCNMAGRHLVSMHAWEWLVRPPVTVTLPSGRSDVPLPDDFGRIVSVDTSGTLLNALVLTTPDYLLQLETSVISLTNIGYWATVVWKDDGEGKLRPHLRVYPAISSTDSLRMFYYAGWRELEDDSSPISMPPFMEALFIEVLYAFAQAHDEHDKGDLTDRLARLHVSPLFMATVSQDASLQDELGEIRGGVGHDEGIYQAATFVGGPYRP